MGAARRERRSHLRAPLPVVGGAPRREDVRVHHEPGGAKAWMDVQKKSLGASERDEQARGAWRKTGEDARSGKVGVLKDECSTNIALTGLYARAPKGERAYGKAPRNWGKNVTLIASLGVSRASEQQR
jgi:hypothetical protein